MLKIIWQFLFDWPCKHDWEELVKAQPIERWFESKKKVQSNK